MDLVLSKERRFVLDDAGQAYTDNALISGYHCISRYLDVFDSLTIVARARYGETEGLTRTTGPGVHLFPVTYFHGPNQFALRCRKVRSDIRQLLSRSRGQRAYIARSPGKMSSLMIAGLLKQGYPYAMEVVGDPYDAFAPGAIRHPLRPYFRWHGTRTLKKHCARACAVSYVTEQALQKRYPPDPDVFTTHYSSLQIDQDVFVAEPRRIRQSPLRFNVISVGLMSTMYKGFDDLLRGFALCCQLQPGFHLTLVGDGQHRQELEALACKQGIQRQVTFSGQLPAGHAVWEQLDQADLFVLASKQEGLPRAMIEAMARGVPCIGSSVGGIPELLDAKEIFSPGDFIGISKKILAVRNDVPRQARMSAQGLEVARRYSNERLQKRRVEFYKNVEAATSEYLLHRTGPVGSDSANISGSLALGKREQ